MNITNLTLALIGLDLFIAILLISIMVVSVLSKKIPSKRVVILVDTLFAMCIIIPLVILLIDVLSGG